MPPMSFKTKVKEVIIENYPPTPHRGDDGEGYGHRQQRKKYIAAGTESVMLRRTAETCAAARLPVTAAQ